MSLEEDDYVDKEESKHRPYLTNQNVSPNRQPLR
jgi:hypothetical protein